MLGVPHQGGLTVAVAFIQEFVIVDGDTSTTNYDHINETIGSASVNGLISHSAGFDQEAGVFRIYDVWENSDAAKDFYENRLGPLLEEMMANDPSATPPQREASYALHNVRS
jgi:hypothetical protein